MHAIMSCNTYAARAEADLASAELRWSLFSSMGDKSTTVHDAEATVSADLLGQAETRITVALALRHCTDASLEPAQSGPCLSEHSQHLAEREVTNANQEEDISGVKMAGHDQAKDKTGKKDEDANASPAAAERKELVQSEDSNQDLDPEERLVWI